MKLYDVAKFYLCTAPGLVLAGVAFMSMVWSGSVYSYVSVPFLGFTTHAVTLLSIGLAYYGCCDNLSYLPLSLRVLSSAALVTFTLSLYDLVWGVIYYAYNGSGLPLAAVFTSLANTAVLLYLDRQRIFLKPRRVGLMTLGLSAGGFWGMCYTGFFAQMAQYNLGLAADPNQNWFWIVSKVCLIMLSGFLVGVEEGECRDPMLVI